MEVLDPEDFFKRTGKPESWKPLAPTRVRITLEVDETFVRALRANVHLSDLHNKDQLDPAQVLALVALTEMRGGLPEQVEDLTPLMWRPHLRVVTEERKVIPPEESKPRE